jgi:hypothetical protein
MSYLPEIRAALRWSCLLAVVAACADPPVSEPPPTEDPPAAAPTAPEPGPNPIVTENALPGTDDWPLTRPADARQIEGFVDATSVAAGGSVKLYVNVAGAKPYDLHVYRMGYYGGKGARLVTTQVNQTGVAQPAPIVTTSGNTTVVSATNWTSTTFTTDPTWTSGMYLLRLSRKDGGAVTHQSWVPLVIRDDQRTADYVFQIAATTYQAYNPGRGTRPATPTPTSGARRTGTTAPAVSPRSRCRSCGPMAAAPPTRP